MSHLVQTAVRLLLLLLFAVAWEVLPRAGLVEPAVLPPLGDVLMRLGELLVRPDVQDAVALTAAEVLVSYVIAVPLGVLIGIAMAESPYFGEIVRPLVFYVFSIPKSIFLPMFILVLGIGFHQKVAYAVFSSIFVVVLSIGAAIDSIKADYILVARSCGATRAQILRWIYLPGMLPLLLETMRITMIFNLTGVMIAEMYASRSGIGNLMAGWGEGFQMTELFAGVILIAAAAITFNELVRRLEARYSAWRS